MAKLLAFVILFFLSTEIAVAGPKGPKFDAPLVTTTVVATDTKTAIALAEAPKDILTEATVEVAPEDFLTQLFTTMKNLGGMPTMLKISAIILLLVSAMKVSFLNQTLWEPLGAGKPWIAPVLGLIGGILGLGAGSVPVTLPLIFAYVTAGGGAVFLHELLDSLKLIPGIGPIYMRLIEIAQKALKANQGKKIELP